MPKISARSCEQVLEDDGHLSHTSLVFGVAGEKYPSVDQVRQEHDSRLSDKMYSSRKSQQAECKHPPYSKKQL